MLQASCVSGYGNAKGRRAPLSSAWMGRGGAGVEGHAGSRSIHAPPLRCTPAEFQLCSLNPKTCHPTLAKGEASVAGSARQTVLGGSWQVAGVYLSTPNPKSAP